MSQTPPCDRERLQRLLGGDALVGLRQRLRRRYESNDAPTDGFTLSRVSREEREALAGLLGRSRKPATSMRLSHNEIDSALQGAELAPNLRVALELLDGPIINRDAAQALEHRKWADIFARIEHAGLATALGDSIFQGVVKRLSGGAGQAAAKILRDTQTLLQQLPAAGISRNRLAAKVLGDAHGLDNARPVTTVLRRVLDPERAFEHMRDVWATQGVLVSELAKPVAVLNLAATGHGPTDHLAQAAAAAGEPLHLSLRALLRNPPDWRPTQTIFVCENPDVLAAAADALGPACPPMVELGGQMSAAPRTLLDQLFAARCCFYYHGDFDWAGLGIANAVIARYDAKPWRYSAQDYQPSEHGPALKAGEVAARWDAALTEKMRSAGVAVHEEAQLDRLLDDLAGFARG